MNINDTLFKMTEEVRELQVALNNATSALGAIKEVIDKVAIVTMTDAERRIALIVTLERDIREGGSL